MWTGYREGEGECVCVGGGGGGEVRLEERLEVRYEERRQW